MQLFTETNERIDIDSVYCQFSADSMWVLDLSIVDFKLANLAVIEECVRPAMKLRIRNTEIIIPTDWFILIYDRDTAQIDVVDIASTTGKQFTAFTYGPSRIRPTPELITVVDYYSEIKVTNPFISKQQMLCHPVGPEDWICIGPNDGYNKYLKNLIVGDLIG